MAFERFLFVMNVPDMSLQVAGDGEGSLAVLAFVWLFASVCAEMACQVGRSRKHLATVFAAVFFLVFHLLRCHGAVAAKGELRLTGLAGSRE